MTEPLVPLAMREDQESSPRELMAVGLFGIAAITGAVIVLVVLAIAAGAGMAALKAVL